MIGIGTGLWTGTYLSIPQILTGLKDYAPMPIGYAVPRNGSSSIFPIDNVASEFEFGIGETYDKMDEILTWPDSYDFTDALGIRTSPVPVTEWHCLYFFRNIPSGMTLSGDSLNPNYWETFTSTYLDNVDSAIDLNTFQVIDIDNETKIPEGQRIKQLDGITNIPWYQAADSDASFADPEVYPARLAQIIKSKGYTGKFSLGDFNLLGGGRDFYPTTAPNNADTGGASGPPKWIHYIYLYKKLIDYDPTIQWIHKIQGHTKTREPTYPDQYLSFIEELTNLGVEIAVTEINVYPSYTTSAHWPWDYVADSNLDLFAGRQSALQVKRIYDRIGNNLSKVAFWSDFSSNAEIRLGVWDSGQRTVLGDAYAIMFRNMTNPGKARKIGRRPFGVIQSGQLDRLPDYVTNDSNSSQGIYGTNMTIQNPFYEKVGDSSVLYSSNSSTYMFAAKAYHSGVGNWVEAYDSLDSIQWSARSDGNDFVVTPSKGPECRYSLFENARSHAFSVTQNDGSNNFLTAMKCFNNTIETRAGNQNTVLTEPLNDITYFKFPDGSNKYRLNEIRTWADSYQLTNDSDLLAVTNPSPETYDTPEFIDQEWSKLNFTDMTSPSGFSMSNISVGAGTGTVGDLSATDYGNAIVPIFEITSGTDFSIDSYTGTVTENAASVGNYDVPFRIYSGTLFTDSTITLTIT